MKKLLFTLSFALLLVACGEETVKEETPVVEAKEDTTKPTQDELDAQLKEEATPIEFVAANADEIEANTKVTIAGEVSNIASQGVGGTFTLTTTESDGVGVYTVENYALADIQDGSTVTIYGVYKGKDELGFPTITATIIE